jgi:hypothetical protein
MQTQEHLFILRVLIIQQDDGLWAAQCIDHDIVAQGDSIKDAKKAFERTIVGQILFDIKHGNTPLAAFPPAPEELRKIFDQAEELADKGPITFPENTPPAYVCSQITKDVRVWG